MRVNLRLGRNAKEDLSRRDSTKVAQYEVLRNDAKRHARPARDDRNARSFVSHTTPQAQPPIDRPFRDGSLIRTLTQHFVLGYFRRVPPGQVWTILSLMLTQMGAQSD